MHQVLFEKALWKEAIYEDVQHPYQLDTEYPKRVVKAQALKHATINFAKQRVLFSNQRGATRSKTQIGFRASLGK